ncbi:MAG: hypothetical protein A3D31_06120 [Candidatus Fluviicola riflensis]|nr:MAG: hypothetical protein CHH17_08895 [Candidatus Fluviicola riflensis]OGS79539.1 MAG: hypothetical protein A3D31_06120 [Candidatus Fluviicola riflensis]OGS86970.1 MAG: hypothetical protein A2724_05580 [Fluviicola sp. RIFCSPHIGHO2_01_FULL_43_53]OGS89761.1 MAG: hypothetical protein A3E30_02325 [Fluviicola sp. RIFCSPHIGHO2_12_FULL_43_24]
MLNMNFKHLLFFLFLPVVHSTFSQSETKQRHKIDSLAHVLRYAKKDTTKAWTNYRLASAYFDLDKDSAKMFALKAHRLAEEKVGVAKSPKIISSYEQLLTNTTEIIANLNTHTGKHSEAIRYYAKCVKCRRKANDLSGAAQCLAGQAYGYMHTGETEKAKKYYEAAIQLHPKDVNRDTLGDLYNDAAFMYMNIGEDTLAERYFNRSIAIRRKTKNLKELSLTYNNLAILFYNRSDYSKATDLWYESMRIAEKTGNKERMAQCFNNIGAVYYQQEDWNKTLEYFRKALRIYKEIGDKYGVPNSYNNLAIVYDHQKKFKEALYYYNLSLRGFRKVDFRKEVAGTLINLAETYLELNELEKAMKACKEAHRLALDSDLKNVLCSSEITEARIEWKHGHLEKAKALSLHALELANSLESIQRKEEASKILYQLYEKQGNWSEAYKHYRIYIQARDSNNNIRVQAEVIKKEATHNILKIKREANFTHRLQQKEMLLQKEKLDNLNKDKLLQARTIYAIVFGILLLLLSLYVWFKSYQRKLQLKELEAEKKLLSLLNKVQLLQSNLNTNLVEGSIIDADKVNEKLNDLLNTSLTQREMDVLLELCKGKDNKEIAESLFVSVNTVRTHLFSIYDKMEVKSRVQAVKKAQNLTS